MNSYNKTRAGLEPTIPAEDLRKILAANKETFKTFSKDHLTSKEALFYQSGFNTPKSESLSKRETDKIFGEDYRSLNYSGFWRESGWIPIEKTKARSRKLYLSRPTAFCPRNNLPYTIPDDPNNLNPWLVSGAARTGDKFRASTGVYIDLKWSGYQNEYDNEKYCLAGVIYKFIYSKPESEREEYTIPYRNYFEFFEHSGYQKFDIGNHRFFRESGYKHGQRIGYNEIFFQSGLNPSGFLNYDFLAVPNGRVGDYDSRLGTIGKNYVGANDELKEPLNVARYNIFFYTGQLPIVYLTGQSNLIKRGFGFGPVYQHNNPKYKFLANDNYKMTFSGIYGESATKELSIFNTGNTVERFYIGINNPNIISIDQKRIPGIPNHGVWSNENQSGKRYGEIIEKIYKIGREANINLRIKINSRGLASNRFHTAHINIYRITGTLKPFTDEFPATLVQVDNFTDYGNGLKNLAYQSEKYTIPIDIYPKTNNSTIISDGNFYQNLQSGDFKPISKVGQVIDINPNNKNHFNLNSSIGLTFYSNGVNLRDLSVSLDTRGKIKRKGIEDGQV
jgi:hypothetical protein